MVLMEHWEHEYKGDARYVGNLEWCGLRKRDSLQWIVGDVYWLLRLWEQSLERVCSLLGKWDLQGMDTVRNSMQGNPMNAASASHLMY